MPKFKDHDFKSPLRKLKDILGKHSSLSSTSSTTDPLLLSDSLTGDDQQLRRPMNAFLLFCKRHRQVVRSRHPWLDNRACTKLLADMWGALDGEEKEKYLQLARECKAAFMKAHPDYRWSGPNRHSGKVTTPGSITTRPHLKAARGEEGAGEGAEEGGSKEGITVGKLADPSQMGGLSLLLLAGQQQAGPKPPACPSAQSPPAATATKGAAVDQTAPSRGHLKIGTMTALLEPDAGSSGLESPDCDESIKSKLFQFAEMCSDQLAIKREYKRPDSDTNGLNNNTILPNSAKHATLTAGGSEKKKKSSKKSSAKAALLPVAPEATDPTRTSICSSERTEREADATAPPQKKEQSDSGKQKKGKKEMGKKRKVAKSSKKKKKKRKVMESTDPSSAGGSGGKTKQDVLSLSWPGALKDRVKQEGARDEGVVKKEEEEEVVEEEKEDKGTSQSDGEEVGGAGGQRKSRRACKGQLYRKLVDQGMLESLQRPERPFNCKKAWRHTQEGMSGFGEGEDEIFEPDDDRPRKGAARRWRNRKRTSSGSSINASDFDYGEINVEARLATLPQYQPEQFRTKKKSILKCKKGSDMYKNAKFIKENGRGKGKIMRSVSSSEMSTSVTGSQKRKARKSSIMHLLPSRDSPIPRRSSATEPTPFPATPTATSSQQMTSPSREAETTNPGSKVKRSLSDPQPFTLSDLADIASMELKPCSSTVTGTTPTTRVDHSSLCFSAVKVS